MKKLINFFAALIAITLYFAVTAPLALGGICLIGHCFMYIIHLINGDNFIKWYQAIILLIILAPIGAFWTLTIAKTYFKFIIERVKIPFITPNVNVFNV